MVSLHLNTNYAGLVTGKRLQLIELKKKRKYRLGMQVDIVWLKSIGKKKNPDSYKVGIARITKCKVVKGGKIGSSMAMSEGCENLNELTRDLMDTYKLSDSKFKNIEFNVITWDWIVGPKKKQKIWDKYANVGRGGQMGFCPKTSDMIMIPNDCYSCDEYKKFIDSCGFDNKGLLKKSKR